MQSRFWAVFVAAFMSAAGARGQCSYEVAVYLDYPIGCGFGFVVTAGLGMNDGGAVVGFYQCPLWVHSEAFLWTPQDGYMTLPRPAGILSSQANDINDDGVIVGTWVRDDVGFRGWVYQDGQYTELEPLPGGSWSQARAINDAGRVTGYRSLPGQDFPYNAFVWSREDGFVDLGVMNGPASLGQGISDSGIVVGCTGNESTVSDSFRWQNGELALLGPIPGGFTSQAFAVSDNGVVVGSGRIPMKGAPLGAPRAFRWRRGVYTMLGTLPDHAWSSAQAVGTAGTIVLGSSWNVDGNPNIGHAFLWRHGVMWDLNNLADAAFNLNRAIAINNRGQILVNAAVLTPIDPPLGDLDHDCAVGIVDLLILLAEWGKTDSSADLDGSGSVDEADLSILFDNWG